MAAVKWTEEQKRAIETTDRGVVVPAAAGSGKTAVLIERTVRLLEDRDKDIPAERLLAVTFAKDAANQIRSKLRAALAKRLVGETDPARREWLSRQQEMLPLARISTINAFCLDLVKDNLNEFDYRGGIRICDDEQAKSILDEGMHEAFEQLCAESPERYEMLIDAFTDNSEKTLEKYVRDLYYFRRSLAFPADWTKKALADLRSTAYTDRIISEYLKRLGSNIAEALKLCDEEAAVAALIPNNDKLLGLCIDDRDLIKLLEKAVATGEIETISKALSELKFGRLTAPSKKGLDDDRLRSLELYYGEFKQIRDSIKDETDTVKKALGSFGHDPYTAMKDSADIFEALSRLTDLLEAAVGAVKLDKGLAEFSDIERMAMSLLVTDDEGVPRRTELAERLRNERTYRVMLIDEYQDVNNLQEMIFRALSDTDDLSMQGRNVFMVGDVKQSIYRFRQSNPRLFREAVKRGRSEDCEQLCEIRLTRNFRSRRNILAFVNLMFRRLMSEQLGEVDYNEEEALYYGAAYPAEDPPVSLMLIDTGENDGGNDGSDDEDEGTLKYYIFGEEELAAAKRIKAMLAAGVPVTEGGVLRPCRPSDFCVLSRNRIGCARAAAAIAHVGLRAESEQTEGYMGSREIVTMVNLLRVIDNPTKDNPMASVMLSPIMGFTAEELGKLRLYCFNEKGQIEKRLFQIIKAVSSDENADEKEADRIETGDPVLESKCRRAAELVERFGFYAISMTLEELIVRIYEETDFFAVASVFENSAQRRANLRLLTQRAAEYERDFTGGIAGFLRFLDSVTAAGGDFKQAVTVTAGSDSVSVKTFHRSKGLEYPFVFLTRLWGSFNLSDTRERLLLNERLGAGVNYLRHDKLMKVKTAAHISMAEATKTELMSEELRLLYVAMTRAKEQLIIPIYIKRSPKPQYDFPTKLGKLADKIAKAGGLNADILAGCSSDLEWICCALMRTKMFPELLQVAERGDYAELFAQINSADTDDADMVWESFDAADLTAGLGKFPAPPKPNAAAAAALRRKYEFSFPAEVTLAPSKRTVTEIVTEMRTREQGDERTDKLFFPQLGTLGEESERLSSAQRGTFTHLFMELADYGRAEKDVRAELERLKTEGRFSEREAKGVYLDAVKAFFASDLYERMKRSEDIRRELKFMVKASDADLGEKYAGLISPDGMLQGVCDCIFREEDGYVLVDYKTDGFTDESELDKYAVQLELYKAALDLILPLPIKSCCIYSFKLKLAKELNV